MIRALIFDFDGLIMDTESPEVETWQTVFAEHGQKFPLDIWIRDVIGASAANFDPAAHLASLTGQIFDVAALREWARVARLDKQSRLSARPGVTDYVAGAKRLGLRLAIASSSPHYWVDGYLRQLSLFDDFEAVICRENAQRVKPAPDLFLAALEALQLPATQALVFEDSPNGILAARRAGIRVVAVPNPITAQVAITGADLILSSMKDKPLEEVLEYFRS